MAREMSVIVTGAASGIGLAAAKKFAQEGAKVMMADVNKDLLADRARELGQSYFCADLSQRESCRNLVEETVRQFGTVNVVVNVAGIQNVAPIPDFPEDKWDFMMRLMLTAPFLLTKYSWNYMKEQGWGRIINISSIHGLVASEFKSAYVSAKHGLIGFTKTAGMEGGPYGITCNAICPAYVMTPLVEGQIADQARVHGISEEEVISNIMLSKASIKKMLEPATVADLVYFLTTDTAASITGAAIPIDGGWTAN
jgi:3-hydroxybutyrate dehydrogenase